MNVNQALIFEIKSISEDNYEYERKIDNYLDNNGYRIIEELNKEECLDILAMLDPDLYLKVKKEMDTMQMREDIEYAIKYIDDFLSNDRDNYVTHYKYIHDDYNAVFLISKRVNITVSLTNNNSPFHTYVTKDDKIYWISYILKCQFNEDLNLTKNDKNLSIMHDNKCATYVINNKYRAQRILEDFPNV